MMVIDLWLTPFTKVEESFNVQAVHDTLFWGPDFERWDHHEFPGIVPRTFLGALPLGLLSSPLSFIFQAIGPPEDKLLSLFAARITLAFLMSMALHRLASSIRRRVGRAESRVFLLAVCCTPHLCFYASRTLPNVFAMLLCTYGVAVWAEATWLADYDELESSASGENKADFEGCRASGESRDFLFIAIVLFVCSTLWFRCDTLVLFGPVLLSMLLSGRVGFLRLAGWGILTGAVALGITVLVDSAMWGKTLWPEGVVFFFNAVENRSSEWGTEPFHWYWTRALPSAMLAFFPFIFVGALNVAPPHSESSTWPPRASPCSKSALARSVCCSSLWGWLDPTWGEIGIPCLAFVALYSVLPHKETRFLFLALPALLATAAIGAVKVARGVAAMAGCSRNASVFVVWLAVMLSSVSLLGTSLFLQVSARNYPGGVALTSAHTVIDAIRASKSSQAALPWRDLEPWQHFYPLHLFPLPTQHGPRQILQEFRDVLTSTDPEARLSWRSEEQLRLARSYRVHRVVIHIDVAPAMTGISRFVERLPSDCALWTDQAEPQGTWARLRTGNGPVVSSIAPLDGRAGRDPDGSCWVLDYTKREEGSFPRDFTNVDMIVTDDPEQYADEFFPVAAIPSFSWIDVSQAIPSALTNLNGTLAERAQEAFRRAVSDPASLFEPFLLRPLTLGMELREQFSAWVLIRNQRSAAFEQGAPTEPAGPAAGTLRGPEAQEATVDASGEVSE
jgi:alpha-1,6-mannosyltransferase